jgi:hypothetical protein
MACIAALPKARAGEQRDQEVQAIKGGQASGCRGESQPDHATSCVKGVLTD